MMTKIECEDCGDFGYLYSNIQNDGTMKVEIIQACACVPSIYGGNN